MLVIIIVKECFVKVSLDLKNDKVNKAKEPVAFKGYKPTLSEDGFKNYEFSYVFDENKIYNIGGYWYYNGNNNVEVKRTTNNKTYYDFYKINYHNIDFTNLTKVSK